jgi:predicted  nucleic acid-binding Zn-ribbon protein
VRRTIAGCEECGNVFTGIYTNDGDLVVRGWDGCPKCDASSLHDVARGDLPRDTDAEAPRDPTAGGPSADAAPNEPYEAARARARGDEVADD